jgi:hypothetical protein
MFDGGGSFTARAEVPLCAGDEGVGDVLDDGRLATGGAAGSGDGAGAVHPAINPSPAKPSRTCHEARDMRRDPVRNESMDESMQGTIDFLREFS